jgi:hypothetical protein
MLVDVNHKTKTHKQLPPEKELELVLWLGFLEDSINNTLTQKRRWKRSQNAWDLHMFFIGVAGIDDAIVGLKEFLSSDNELWSTMRSFRKKIKRYNLRELRNDIVHREKLFKLQDRTGKPLARSPLLILGAYIEGKDEYVFGTHKINISDAFRTVEALLRDLKRILATRLRDFYITKEYEGMIPWTHLHMFTTTIGSRTPRLSNTR